MNADAWNLTRGERERLASMLLRPKYELIPLKNVMDQISYLPEGAIVTVTASPAKGMKATVELAVVVADHGFEVIPHLSARLTKDQAELEWILSEIADTGITEAFVVGGDEEEAGAFPDGLSLLAAMEEIGHPFERIGVPGYPEGHPFISDELLQQALEAKTHYASSITTQMCFDDEALRDWIGGQRGLGIELPVYLGIPGVAEVRKLFGIAARIGVGDSRRFLSANMGLLGRLVRPGGYAPDELLASLAGTWTDPAAKVAGLHIYTFNQVETTERWRNQFLAELES